MATNTVTVSGTIVSPDGNTLTSGNVTFRLSGSDIETAAGETIVPKDVVAQIGSDGTISAELWANQAGEGGTVYSVFVTYPTSSVDKVVVLGRIQLTDVATADLDDLLDTGEILPGTTYTKVAQITVAADQTEYDNAVPGSAELVVLYA